MAARGWSPGDGEGGWSPGDDWEGARVPGPEGTAPGGALRPGELRGYAQGEAARKDVSLLHRLVASHALEPPSLAT